MDWKVMQIVSSVSGSVGGVMKPVGFENAQGVLSADYAKDAADPQWDNDPGMKKFYAFLEQYYPEADKLERYVGYGYGVAQTLVKVLEMCGDDLTRANVMKQAASLKDFAPDTLLPGIKINTSATDFAPIEQLQMRRFKGERWELLGEVIGGELSN
jgi:branched-chain amino acid transport system substrate-binding protein